MNPTATAERPAVQAPGTQQTGEAHDSGRMMHGSYGRFMAMIATSTATMFVLMYSLVFRLEHVWFADTRFLMALYMGAMMTVVMLTFMLGMYRNTTVNAAIFGGAAIVFGVALYLARSQSSIGDVAYMKAMIPHHSIAILTSSRANLADPRVRSLADSIIVAQNREIAQMEALIRDLQQR